MKIEYTYKIINVDKGNKSMEIVYESEKYGVLCVGARLPYENESIEDVVRMYNPTQYWLEQETETLEVDENTFGIQQIDLSNSNDEQQLESEVDVSKISLSKYQAFYVLAANGLLDKADSAVKERGSLSLINGWNNHSNLIDKGWSIRTCKETLELQKLLNLSSEKMNQLFILGSTIDYNNPKKALDGNQSKLFDYEVKIWELKEKLKNTDYKTLPDYDGDANIYVNNRQLWREEIRNLRKKIQT
jgi:hypothetical protein